MKLEMVPDMNGGEVLLSIDNVSKTYLLQNFATILRLRRPQRSIALRGVSFDLRAGEITALLGPNGAGKTTLATIIADLTRADDGQVTVAGVPVPERSREAQQHIGYLTTNDRSFFWRLSGRKNLEFFAVLHGFSQAKARQRTDEMLERFNLASQADRPFHTYSTGMKKRLGLARAFLHDPKVLQQLDRLLRSSARDQLYARAPRFFARDLNKLLDFFGRTGFGFLPYSLRRGGATWHFHKYGSMALTCELGRWQNERTARIYIEDAAASLAEIKLSSEQQTLLRQFVKLL